jgi:hypothetical protein
LTRIPIIACKSPFNPPRRAKQWSIYGCLAWRGWLFGSKQLSDTVERAEYLGRPMWITNPNEWKEEPTQSLYDLPHFMFGT